MVEQLDAARAGQLLEELDAFGVVLCADSGVVGEVGELRLVLVELIAGRIERIVRLLPAHVLDHCGFFLPGEVPLSLPSVKSAAYERNTTHRHALVLYACSRSVRR